MITTQNPFQITTPEDLSAQDTVQLFVDVFSDFQKLLAPGHVFIMGPRGAGKSMMFRYLQPDCQKLVNKCSFEQLEFFGIYVPLKNANFTLSELNRLENRHAADLLNEHLMIMHISIKFFENLASQDIFEQEKCYEELKVYYDNVFIPKFSRTSEQFVLNSSINSGIKILNKILSILNIEYDRIVNYIKSLAFTKELYRYDGELFDYLRFLLPLLDGFKQLTCFPKGTIFLLLDDAHYLSKTQTRVLNTWVATRTSNKVSLKISSQYNYKNFYTINGATIDTPHDYLDIDIVSVYTNDKSKYKERIRKIVQRRLDKYGIKADAEQFFPIDSDQEKLIEQLELTYKERYDKGEGKGANRTDDARRYARPDFIKNLAGVSKSSHTYSYAGFQQLVHLSSGIVRHFLHPAYLMYAETLAKSDSATISFIPVSIQDEIVRRDASDFFFTDLEKLRNEGHEDAYSTEDINKLSNLIEGLGSAFRAILLSDRSERRVFSIAISDKISDDVSKIFNIGVELGYLHKSSIGKKANTVGGKTRLFILNRRLAPLWTLDPTGFAGYWFVPNSDLQKCLCDVKWLASKINKNCDQVAQYTLFDLIDDSNNIPNYSIIGGEDGE